MKLRSVLVTASIVIVPFAILVVLFWIVYTINNKGEGPDDGAIMLAFFVAVPTALMVAAPLWAVSLIYLVCRRPSKID